jgi:phosphoribosyl-AMP cyclohydrolase
MKFKHVLILGLLLLFVSCVSAKPARVENGYYINPAHQFSLRVPNGWKASAKPTSIPKSYVSNKNFKTAFFNPKKKSFIIVLAEKTNLDWGGFKYDSDNFSAKLEEYYAREKKKLLKKPDIKYYRYQIYIEEINNCENDCIAAKVDFQHQNVKHTAYNVCYKSKYGMLYSVTLIFVDREKTYATGLGAFKKVVDSFQRR